MSRSELEAFWAGAAPSSRERFTSVRLIGSGAYSVVAKATDAKTGDTVAIKRIAEVFYDAQEAKKVLREIRLLRDFRHPNVIALRALVEPSSMETFDDIFMITDFMESDLRRIIKSKQTLSAERVRSYMAQLFAGLQHVHAISGIHRGCSQPSSQWYTLLHTVMPASLRTSKGALACGELKCTDSAHRSRRPRGRSLASSRLSHTRFPCSLLWLT